MSCIYDIQEAHENLVPVIFLAGSALCNDVVMKKGGFPGESKKDQDGDGQVDDPALRGDGKIENPVLNEFVT